MYAISAGGDAEAMREALLEARVHIEHMHDRCNSDDEVAPFDRLLAKIDRSLALPLPQRADKES
jgi:hypothetical protein